MDAFTSIHLRGRNKNTNMFDFYSDLLCIYPFAKKNKFLYVFLVFSFQADFFSIEKGEERMSDFQIFF